jgi:hypothetical protein
MKLSIQFIRFIAFPILSLSLNHDIFLDTCSFCFECEINKCWACRIQDQNLYDWKNITSTEDIL